MAAAILSPSIGMLLHISMRDATASSNDNSNLSNLYDYCIFKTTDANLRNDVTLLDEVIGLIQPVADGWSQIVRLY